MKKIFMMYVMFAEMSLNECLKGSSAEIAWSIDEMQLEALGKSGAIREIDS